jgi:hypothetical protein
MNFVTHFDSHYLPQGLALYRSLLDQVKDFTLWVVAMDEKVAKLLEESNLPAIKVLKIVDFENQDLLTAKKTRTFKEYCWTVTPFLSDFVFNSSPSCQEITYLDADLYFYNRHYTSIYEEFRKTNKSVLITPHAYAPQYDESHSSGLYCVQFLIFKRFHSQEIVKLWQRQCLDWCYDRVEPGKFGDQKYLEEWPIRYGDQTHVLTNPGLIQGPWNAMRFPYSEGAIWHFHSLKILFPKGPKDQFDVQFGRADRVPNPVINQLLPRYFDSLKAGFAMLEISKLMNFMSELR